MPGRKPLKEGRVTLDGQWRKQTPSEKSRDGNENMRHMITFHVHSGSRKCIGRGTRLPNLKAHPMFSLPL